MKWIFLWLFAFSCHFSIAAEANKSNVPNISIQTHTYFPKVNPMTGEYVEEICDFIVAGSEPLSIRRFYNHTFNSPTANLYSSWRINPETLIRANFEYTKNPYHPRNVLIGFRDGGAVLLEKQRANTFSFDPEIQSSWINAGSDEISGQTNLKNITVTYWKHHAKDEEKFSYAGRLIDGTGRKVEFETNYFKWLKKKNLNGNEQRPECWTPYHCPIKKETLPNGNFLVYTYEKYGDHKHWPAQYRIKQIQSRNSCDQLMGCINLDYRHNPKNEIKLHEILITGSDGRSARLGSKTHDKNENINYAKNENYRYVNLLTQSARPDSPLIKYFYDSKYRLEKITSSNKTKFVTKYNDEGKVSEQLAPVGSNGQLIKIATFDYRPYSTEIRLSEGLNLIYNYNHSHRLSSVEKYLENTLHSIEKNAWDAEGQLISKSLVSPTKKVLTSKSYIYDLAGNVLEETTKGDLTGTGKEDSYTIYRTYYLNEFNLKESETDGSGLVTHYSYKKGTNLLQKEHVYHEERLLKRIFYEYDVNAICVRKIVDDGITEDPNNLEGVTHRLITVTKPKTTLPCYGLPEEVEEKTIDDLGNEVLLNRTVYTYHNSGKIEKEEFYDAKNCLYAVKTYEYDKHERLCKSTDPLGNVTTYEYDANFNLIRQKDALSEYQWEYDDANRAILENHSGLISRKEYNTRSQLTAETDPCGNTTRYGLNPLGQILSITTPDGATTFKEYDCAGNETKITDPLGYITRKEYNCRGQVTHIFYPDGTDEHFTYTLNGNLATQTDKLKCVTHFTYDLFNRLIKKEIFSPSGELLKTTQLSYTAFHLISETDPEGNITTFSYDFAGRKIAEQKNGSEIRYFYDVLGRQNCTQKGDVLNFKEFDLLGRIIETRTEDLEGTVHFRENFAYDAHGNRTHITTCAGTATTFYNSLNLPVKIVSPDGSQTKIFYSYDSLFSKTTLNPAGVCFVEIHDPCHRIKEKQVKNPQGHLIQHSEYEYDKAGNLTICSEHIYEEDTFKRTSTTKWEYGPLNRVTSLLECGEKLTQYQYTSAGLLKTLIKPDGVHLKYTYDALGRVQRLQSSVEDIDYTYRYDRCDRILSIFDRKQESTLHRRYDPLGNLLEETLGNQMELKSAYDLLGRRIAQTFPDQTHASYIYKGAYLHKISYSGHTLTYTARNLSGKPTLINPPLVNIELSYDSSLRLKNLVTPYYTALDYTYDSRGNLVSYEITDTRGAISNCYTYDDLNQLTSEIAHTYSYDSFNNRIQKDSCKATFNELSLLTDDGEQLYTYDPNGNLIQVGSVTLSYDSLDRLTKVNKNGEHYEYIYDALHRRLTKKTPTEIVHYIWDGQNEIGSSKGELRILGEGLGAELGAAVFIKLNNQIYIPFHDHRGALVSLIDLKATPQSTYRYTAFGEELLPPQLSPWRFSSKRVDEETGLIYFGRRYYYPQTGRWITPDPQGFADGPNLYAYVHNNPLISYDLYGLLTHPWSTGRPLGILTQWLFKGIEFIGSHLLPIPHLNDVVEGIGRWGSGGRYSDQGIRSHGPQIVKVPGKKVEGISVDYANGMSVHLNDAVSATCRLSKMHDGVETTLFYNPTRGFVMDIVDALLAKCGILCPYEKMCANEISSKLKQNPSHQFRIYAHSKAGTHIMNVGKAVGETVRKQMDVYAFGPATLIPKKMFRSAYNYVSRMDPIPLTSPLRYGRALLGIGYNVHFLRPSSSNPFSEHSIGGETYNNALKNIGGDFAQKYFTN